MIEENYSGYKITYDEGVGQHFFAKPLDKEKNLPQLNDSNSFRLKERIRQAVSRARATKFKQIPILTSNLRQGKITSIVKVRTKWNSKEPQAEVRVSVKDKDEDDWGSGRMALNIPSNSSPIYEDTPENRKVVIDINLKYKEIGDLKKKLTLLDPEAVFRQHIKV